MVEERHISLKYLHTFGMEVQADYLIRVSQVAELEEIYKSQRFKAMKKLVLGGGSNVLFTHNFIGLVLKNELSGIKIEEDSDNHILVSFGGGENWHQCVLWAIERDLGGIENLSLIPGTIGAAPIQNIGAYGVELRDVFHSLEAFEIKTGKVIRFYREDCKFGYRTSVFKTTFKGQYVITKVYLRLDRHPEYKVDYGDVKQTLDQMGVTKLSPRSISEAIIQIRQSKLPDPLDVGNAGSFFKNPVVEKSYFESLQAAFESIPFYEIDDFSIKIPAGWLIQQAGWKGRRVGNVGVHDKQALVLVNYGGGTGKDLVKLAGDVKTSVFKMFGVDLEPEVNII